MCQKCLETLRTLRPAREGADAITREAFFLSKNKQQRRVENRAALLFKRYFELMVDLGARFVRTVRMPLSSSDANVQAWLIASQMPKQRGYQELIATGRSALLPAFLVGAHSEQKLTSKSVKFTTAQALAEFLEDEIPDSITLGPHPQWMLDAAADSMRWTFDQDYWQKVNEHTWSDMQDILEQGIKEGLSVRRLAKLITEQMGGEYTTQRATMVALTETANFLNAGHAASIKNVEDELGFPVGKEWLAIADSRTRPSHAAMNTVTTETADGLFNLSGYQIPHPGHWSLPASERIRCRCTIISAPLSMELFGEPELLPAVQTDLSLVDSGITLF